ncbi:MAG TPA: SRPBCC family protein [Pseudomonadales bacterium]|jgi:hypothetical protein
MSYFQIAPARFEASVVVKATPEQIFEVFEDAHAWTVWADPITHVEWTSPKPYGLGTTRTVTMSGGMIGEEEFIAWEPGKRMAFRFTQASMDSVEAFGEDYRVEDLGGGDVRVTWIMAMSPKGISKIFLKLTGFMMRFMQRKFMKQFKAYVESRYGAAS